MTSVLSGWRFDALIDTWWPAKADREEPLSISRSSDELRVSHVHQDYGEPRSSEF
jgi:hypothetical protein